MYLAVLVFRSCGTYHRYFAIIAYIHDLAAQVEWEVSGILVYIVHLEYIISGSQHHIFTFCQDHGLQYIYYLGNICHFQTVGVFVEDIEAKRGNESVTQCILLVKMSWDSAGFFIPPGTPLIEHEGYALFRIIFVHDGAVLFDNVFYLTALTHCPVIVVFVELSGCSLTSAPAGYGVIMERESVHTSTYAVH